MHMHEHVHTCIDCTANTHTQVCLFLNSDFGSVVCICLFCTVCSNLHVILFLSSTFICLGRRLYSVGDHSVGATGLEVFWNEDFALELDSGVVVAQAFNPNSQDMEVGSQSSRPA